MREIIRFYITLVILNTFDTHVKSDCSTKYTSVSTFGADCMYRCHCRNDDPCNNINGHCTNGCDPGWMGPACQYRNIVKTSDIVKNYGGTTNTAKFATNAIDGDIRTCSSTTPLGDGRREYWRIELERSFHIVGIIIRIRLKDADKFKQFRVEYGPSESDFPHVCYQHPDIPGTVNMEVMCMAPIITKHLRVILHEGNIPLRLCEVEIYGGREIAFNRQTDGSPHYNTWSANQAVDGRFLSNPEIASDADRAGTCYAGIGTAQNNPWWIVDFGSTYDIENIFFYGRELLYINQMKGYFISIGPLHGFTRIYNDTIDNINYQPKKTEFTSTFRGQILKVEKPGTPEAVLTICELMVFADCPPGQCGWNCSVSCHCKTQYITGTYKITGTCPDGCSDRWTGVGNKCDQECGPTKWGPQCTNTCGNCHNPQCSVLNGNCIGGCLGSWKPPMCIECVPGKYGANCSQECGHCLNKAVCNNSDGTCRDGCESGWKESLCQEVCDPGTFGFNCNETCGKCSSLDQCDVINGMCRSGCKPGYHDNFCNTQCDTGKYGLNCSNVCGHCSANTPCNFETGHCETGCVPGFQGVLCKEKCYDGRYGANCTLACAHCNGAEICHHVDGHCNSCSPGYKGNMCDELCSNSTYGQDCIQKCGYCSGSVQCNQTSGVCHNGCASGYIGGRCVATVVKEKPAEESTSVLGLVLAGIGVLIIIIIVAVVVCVRRRKPRNTRSQLKTEETRKTNGDKTEATQYYNHQAIMQRSVDMKEGTDNLPGTSVSMSVNEAEATYGNIPTKTAKRTMCVSDIRHEVTTELKHPDKLVKEYEALPRGLVYSTGAALKPNNRKKNRYKSMYPYDASRVQLPVIDGVPDSDYINASYIDGYQTPRKYIAAQGAIDDTVVDIWRMIWSENIRVIVMLTNLYEMGKMKCVQYWFDRKGVFGDFEIELKNEDVYANFIVRTFKCTQLSSGKGRTITQYHFTTWPDKDVPDTALSLVQFWKKIRMSKEGSCTPWMVHCSAGVGRTGTFIALDYLYDQGQTEKHISVNGGVATIREQRLTMVQTKEQYLYLHAVLSEALSPIGKVCKSEDYVADVYPASENTTVQKVTEEYNAINEDTAAAISIHSDEMAILKKTPSAHQPDNITKSRKRDIFPDDLFRPRLLSALEGHNDFINAVYISTFRQDKQLIMTQVPLAHTVVDFIRMVWDLNINTVVLLEEDIDNKECCYWPDNGECSLFGPFTAELVSQSQEAHCVNRTIRYTCTGKNDSKEVHQYQFTSWAQTNDNLPTTQSLLTFIADIQNLSPNAPIVIQCLDGAQRSGLFTVLWCILDRMKTEREVAISETVRLVRTRRKQVITGMKQYEFCHKVVHDYLESIQLYANTF